VGQPVAGLSLCAASSPTQIFRPLSPSLITPGPDVAKHIRLIDVKNTNKVEVITFNIPDNAAGNIIVVLKQRGRWIQDKEHLGVWMKHF
jgi:hypothetical protein